MLGEKQISSMPALSPKLIALRSSLLNELLHALSDVMQRKTAVIHLTGLLERLQAGTAARSTFLTMRTELMRKRVRALRQVLNHL